MSRQSTDDTTQPGFFSRLGGFLGRLLTALLKLGLAAVLLAILAGIAWLIYRELDRSFDSVVARVEANTRRIELAEEDAETYWSANEAQREELEELQVVITTRDAAIEVLETNIASEQARRDAELVALQAQFDDLIARTETMTASLTFLNEGLVTLQGDTTANVSEIDALGGAVDAVQAEVTGQADEIATLQTEISAFSAEEFARMRQALALFRVWEMVSRARLRLLEQNVGLAAADIEAALTSVDAVLLVVPAESATATGLAEVRGRLVQAADSLPVDPPAAARDLETAWEVLDGVMAELLGVETLQPSASTPPSIAPTATPTS
jgi:hypothetical protein